MFDQLCVAAVAVTGGGGWWRTQTTVWSDAQICTPWLGWAVELQTKVHTKVRIMMEKAPTGAFSWLKVFTSAIIYY